MQKVPNSGTALSESAEVWWMMRVTLVSLYSSVIPNYLQTIWLVTLKPTFGWLVLILDPIVGKKKEKHYFCALKK